MRQGKEKKIEVVIGSREDAPELLSDAGESVSSEELGLELANLDDNVRRQLKMKKNENGVLVRSVKEASPAQAAGVLAQDVIMQVSNKVVQSVQDFEKVVKQSKGKTLMVLVKRGAGRLFLVIERE